ncbi:TRAP transporter large permease [uncultured Roseovarius sp.]|uniref:TRAP transporter large permease n=1 Tax=uncultured Roseovarius sp. TaxID=293344 RepID=UPI002602FFC9|nr:TRAP transporter large permease [uncultured Roseovarius sp.]
MVFFLLAMNAPIGVALGLPAALAIFIKEGSVTSVATQTQAAVMGHYLLTAIPFFILSSAFLTSGGAARRIVDFAVKALGHLRGGLGVAGVFSCMQFAAMSGSSPATVAAVGPIAIDGMKRANYPVPLAAGIIATAGTLGILIPPSIVMVVYAASAEVSTGRMFLAGIVPGLVAGLMLMVAIWLTVGRAGVQRMDWAGWRAVFKAGFYALFGLLLIVIILAGLYWKPEAFFTPTEAAAFAAVYSFFVATTIYRGVGIYKDVPWVSEGETTGQAVARGVRQFATSMALMPVNLFHPGVRQVLIDSIKMTLMLMFIIFNALIFSHVLTELGIPFEIANMVTEANMPAWVFLIVLNIILLIGGQFMEPSGLLLIVVPIVVPVAQSLNIDLIHLGIIMVVNMEIGLITPPVGLNLFVTSSITGLSVLNVMKAALPWTGMLIVLLMFVTYIPALSIGFPNFIDWMFQ